MSEQEKEFLEGTVKWFNSAKGWGFIAPDGVGEDLFVHFTGIEAEGYRKLNDGDRVEFTIAQGKKGPCAVEVRTI